MNMMKEIRRSASIVGMPVTSMDDVPYLVEALRDWGKFGTAQTIEDWYKRLNRRVRVEHDNYAATS
jgi:hypothetical protein